jgi:hypothetical protein
MRPPFDDRGDPGGSSTILCAPLVLDWIVSAGTDVLLVRPSIKATLHGRANSHLSRESRKLLSWHKPAFTSTAVGESMKWQGDVKQRQIIRLIPSIRFNHS